MVRCEWVRVTRRSQGGASHGLRVPDSIALAHAADCCSIVLDQPFFLVRCGVQDCGVQDGGDLSRMLHDARTSPPIRPARREYSKCSPFY